MNTQNEMNNDRKSTSIVLKNARNKRIIKNDGSVKAVSRYSTNASSANKSGRVLSGTEIKVKGQIPNSRVLA
jgi:hypothetical protein